MALYGLIGGSDLFLNQSTLCMLPACVFFCLRHDIRSFIHSFINLASNVHNLLYNYFVGGRVVHTLLQLSEMALSYLAC